MTLPDPDLITKSNVYFGPESVSKESYKPHKTEQNIQQEIEQPKVVTYPESNILTGPGMCKNSNNNIKNSNNNNNTLLIYLLFRFGAKNHHDNGWLQG